MASTTIAGSRPVCVAFALARSVVAFAALSGCVGAGTPAVAEPIQRAAPSPVTQQARVIVKFHDPALNPARQDFLKELARDTGVTLVYIRAMSGGAHVLQIEGPVDAGHFRRVVEGLAKKPGVEYAEADRRMRHMLRY